MHRPILFCVAAIAISCGPAEEQPAQDQSAATAPVSLADFAGTWTVTAMEESSDSVLITYELNATATPDGWTSTLPGRPPMPVRVVLADSDSVVAEAGPYESALRRGVMVTTRTVARLQGEILTGTIVAHYGNNGADSVLTGRLHGMRKTQRIRGAWASAGGLRERAIAIEVDHVVPSTPENLSWGWFPIRKDPVLTVRPGEVVEIHTDGGGSVRN